jgi:hypothetical protein
MHRVSFAYGTDEKWLKNFVEAKRRDHLEDMGLSGRTIMK